MSEKLYILTITPQKINFKIIHIQHFFYIIIIGTQSWMKWKSEIELLSDVFYFLLTTVNGILLYLILLYGVNLL